MFIEIGYHNKMKKITRIQEGTVIKPKLWSYKSGLKARKLRPASKKYLSFKLKSFWATKRTHEKEILPLIKEKAKEILKNPIRVWVKMSYKGKSPLFIEAFIEGYSNQEEELRADLMGIIASAFGSWTTDHAEVGVENINKISTQAGKVNYKHNLNSSWRSL